MTTFTLRINGIPWDQDDRLAFEAVEFAEWTPLTIECAPVPDAQAATLVLGGDALGPPATSPFDPTWRWQWTPRGVAGLVLGDLRVTLADGSSERHEFHLRLVPRLLDQETWTNLLADVARLARSVAVSLGGSAFAGAVLLPPPASERTALEDLLVILQRHSADLEQLVATLSANPETILQTTTTNEPLETLTVPAPDALATPPTALDVEQHAGEPALLSDLRQRLGGLPRTLAARHSTASTNLPEHRWLLGLIQRVERRLRWLRSQAEIELARLKPDSRAALALISLSERIERTLGTTRRLRSTPLLHGLTAQTAPPQSQRLVRDRRYRPLRRIWRELRSTPLLALHVPALELPIADLPTLYEQWTALATAEALLDLGGTIISQHTLSEDISRERWTLTIPPSSPLVELDFGAQRWRLRYQARYDQRPDALGMLALDGYVRIPDLVIEIESPGAPPSLIVIDAKYRRAPDGRVPQDALDDAYAYRGSLGFGGASAVRYAAIVYPGQRSAEDFGSIGTIPLVPGATAALHDFLLAQLNNALQ